MLSWHIVDLIAPRRGVELTIFRSRVRRRTDAPPRHRTWHCPANWSVNFMPCNLDGPSFSRRAFSVNPFVLWKRDIPVYQIVMRQHKTKLITIRLYIWIRYLLWQTPRVKSQQLTLEKRCLYVVEMPVRWRRAWTGSTNHHRASEVNESPPEVIMPMATSVVVWSLMEVHWSSTTLMWMTAELSLVSKRSATVHNTTPTLQCAVSSDSDYCYATYF